MLVIAAITVVCPISQHAHEQNKTRVPDNSATPSSPNQVYYDYILNSGVQYNGHPCVNEANYNYLMTNINVTITEKYGNQWRSQGMAEYDSRHTNLRNLAN